MTNAEKILELELKLNAVKEKLNKATIEKERLAQADQEDTTEYRIIAERAYLLGKKKAIITEKIIAMKPQLRRRSVETELEREHRERQTKEKRQRQREEAEIRRQREEAESDPAMRKDLDDELE